MKYLESLKRKILAGEEFDRWLYGNRFRGRKVVFTNGCFDILHRGHIQYLAESADLGDLLVIGLNTDASVRRIKGNDRPLVDMESRALTLAALVYVSAIVFFDEDTPLELIKKVKPDYLVKGGDYLPQDIAGYDYVTSYGGKVVTISLVEGFSTTGLLKKINPGF